MRMKHLGSVETVDHNANEQIQGEEGADEHPSDSEHGDGGEVVTDGGNA